MLRDIQVRDWMTTSVITIRSDTPITNAHHIMKEYGIRRLPVVDGEELVGIVTVGDIREASPSGATTLSIWEINYLWAQLKVDGVMTRRVLTVSPDDPIIHAAEIMLDKKVSGLVVIDEHNHVVGILTESDIFRMLVKLNLEETQPHRS